MELRNAYLRSGEGDREARLFAHSQIQQLLRNTNLGGGKITVFKIAEIAGVAEGCLPLKLFQLLPTVPYLFEFGVFCFCVFLKSVQVTQGHARHHLTNLLLPKRLFKALHLLQWSGEFKKFLQPF